MSDLRGIPLPTHEDLGHADVVLLDNPADYPVATPELPGRSDQALYEAAEANDDWDLCETHGVFQDPLPLRALWNRFEDGYEGRMTDAPGGFIKTVLGLQRTIPIAQEYAATLAEKGLLRANEVADLPEEFSYGLLDADKDEDRARAYFKVLYLANVAVPELRTAKLAADYASDRMQPTSNERARRRAAEALARARGIEEGGLRVVMDSLSTSKLREQADRLRVLGMPDDLIEQLREAPRPANPLLPCFKFAGMIAETALSSGSLNGQIAYRQFFGMQNLATMVATNAAFEKPFDDKSLAFSADAIHIGIAGTTLVNFPLAADKPFRSLFYNEGLVSELGGVPEQMAALGALATFIMREPALNGPQKPDHVDLQSDVLGHHVVDMVTADYRTWLDRQMEKERLANQ